MTDSLGYTLTNHYNNQGLLIASTNNFGQVTRIVYDIEDRPVSVTDANGVTVQMTYDPAGRLLTRTYPDGGVERFEYSPRGLTGYTNQLGHATTNVYDALGRKTAQMRAGLETNRFSYSPAGELIELRDGKDQKMTWLYDEYCRQIEKRDHTNGLMFRYTYDANGWLTNRWTA